MLAEAAIRVHRRNPRLQLQPASIVIPRRPAIFRGFERFDTPRPVFASAGATARGRRAAGRRSGSAGSSWSRCRRRGCAAPALPQTGQGCPYRPCTAISGAERRHLLRESVAASGPQPSVHSLQRLAAWRRSSRATSSSSSLLRQRHRRQPRAMQDLVGVGVADAAEQPRVGERALERVVLAAQPRRERGERRRPGPRARRDRARRSAASPRTSVQRGAPLRAGLGEEQRAGREVERGEHRLRAAASRPRARHCSRPAIIRWMTRKSSSVELKHDALADAPQRRDLAGLPAPPAAASRCAARTGWRAHALAAPARRSRGASASR